MILVIGGVASGKRTFLRSLGYADGDMADAVLDERPVVLNAQELARADAAQLGGTGEVSSELVAALAEKEAVVCVEVGAGVVPLDRDERAWRERAGRLSCALAERADRVVRMVCGIPVELKR